MALDDTLIQYQRNLQCHEVNFYIIFLIEDITPSFFICFVLYLYLYSILIKLEKFIGKYLWHIMYSKHLVITDIFSP